MIPFNKTSLTVTKLSDCQSTAYMENLAYYGLTPMWTPDVSDEPATAATIGLLHPKLILGFTGNISKLLGGNLKNLHKDDKLFKIIKGLTCYHIFSKLPKSEEIASSSEITHLLANGHDLPEFEESKSLVHGLKAIQLLRSPTVRRELFTKHIDGEINLCYSIEARILSEVLADELGDKTLVEYVADTRGNQDSGDAVANRWAALIGYLALLSHEKDTLVQNEDTRIDIGINPTLIAALEVITNELCNLFEEEDANPRVTTMAEFQRTLTLLDGLAAVVTITNSKFPVYAMLEECNRRIESDKCRKDLFALVQVGLLSITKTPDVNIYAPIPIVNRACFSTNQISSDQRNILKFSKALLLGYEVDEGKKLEAKERLELFIGGLPGIYHDLSMGQLDYLIMGFISVAFNVDLNCTLEKIGNDSTREQTLPEHWNTIARLSLKVDIYKAANLLFLSSGLCEDFAKKLQAVAISIQAIANGYDHPSEVPEDLCLEYGRIATECRDRAFLKLTKIIGKSSNIITAKIDLIYMDVDDISELTILTAKSGLLIPNQIRAKLKELSELSASIDCDPMKLVELSQEVVALKNEADSTCDMQSILDNFIDECCEAFKGLFEYDVKQEPKKFDISDHDVEAMQMIDELEIEVSKGKKSLAESKQQVHELTEKANTLASQLSSQSSTVTSCNTLAPQSLISLLSEEKQLNQCQALEVAHYVLGDKILLLPSAYESILKSNYSSPMRIVRELVTLGTAYLDSLKAGHSDDVARKVFSSKVFRANESATVMGNPSLRGMREWMYNGKNTLFDKHLAMGSKASNHSHVRIYFKAELENNRVVVAYVGNHLDTASAI